MGNVANMGKCSKKIQKEKNLKYKITFFTCSLKTGDKKIAIKAAVSYNEIFNKCIHSFNIYWTCYMKGNIIGTGEKEINKKVSDFSVSATT